MLAFALWLAISSGWGMQTTSGAAPGGPESPELPVPPEVHYVFDGIIPGDAYYFDQVMDVATDENGNVYAAEQFGHRIVKLSAEGEVLAEWQGDDSFAPKAVAVDNEGYVYAATGEFVHKLDMDNLSIAESWEIDGMYASGLAVDSENGIVYVADYNYSGIRLLDTATGNVEGWTEFTDSSELQLPFEYPYDVAIDGEGDVYVADRDDRIVKLNRYGAYLDQLDGAELFDYLVGIAVDEEGNIFATDYDNNSVVAIDSSFEVVTSAGGYGMGAGEFDSPQGIAVSADGSVYVAETTNRRIQKLAADTLASEAVWGTFGTEQGQFFIPEGIAVDGDGHVYVADQGNERIQLFDRQLTASRDGGGSDFSPYGLAVDAGGRLYMTSDNALLQYNPATNAITLMNSSYSLMDPMEVAVDADGYIYVANTGGHNIVKFDAAGEAVLEMEGVRDPNSFYFRPTAIAVDSERGIVYSADSVNIQTFDTEGDQLEESWGEPEGGGFGFISGIALDSEGNLFVTDETNSRIQKFNPGGELIASWGGPGKGEGEFDGLAAIAVDRAGNVYVTETGNHRVQKFAPATHTVSFDSNEGTAVEAQTVSHGATVAEPAAPTRAGYTFEGWYADSELTEAYVFEMAVTGDVTLYAKWTANVTVTPPPGGGNNDPSPENEPESPAHGEEGLIINGEPGHAVITHTTDAIDRSVMTVGIGWNESNQGLIGKGLGAIISIQSDEDSDVLVAELGVELLKALIEQGGKIEMHTIFATYNIDAKQLNLEALIQQLGSNVKSEDAVVRIEVARSAQDIVQLLMDKAEADGFEVIAPPVHFASWVKIGETEIEAKSFDGYVERTIVIPNGVNPAQMTTGVVIGPDGSVRHVPTRLVEGDGGNAGAVNSLTNSDYALIGRETAFKDMDEHWAQNTVKDMGSRLIAFGIGEDSFAPDRPVTRAEFAAILVRGLGLAPDEAAGQSVFSDIDAGDWYAGAIGTAYENGLIGGFEDGTFRPNDQVTREQAMAMIANAMRLTGLASGAAGDRLSDFSDAETASGWAKDALNAGLDTGILTGITADKLAPKATLTRAQAAVMIQRLLEKSGLI